MRQRAAQLRGAIVLPWKPQSAFLKEDRQRVRIVGARRNVMDKIGSTDHLAFIGAGLPGFNTLQDYQDYDVRTHHTNADFYERLSPKDLQQAAIVLATFAYHAAMRDQKIPRAPMTP